MDARLYGQMLKTPVFFCVPFGSHIPILNPTDWYGSRWADQPVEVMDDCWSWEENRVFEAHKMGVAKAWNTQISANAS